MGRGLVRIHFRDVMHALQTWCEPYTLVLDRIHGVGPIAFDCCYRNRAFLGFPTPCEACPKTVCGNYLFEIDVRAARSQCMKHLLDLSNMPIFLVPGARFQDSHGPVEVRTFVREPCWRAAVSR